MTSTHLRSLYICYLSIDEPLVETQVIAYLRGLAADGHTIHLLTFDVSHLSSSYRIERGRDLEADGIRWHRLRYHKTPSIPATALDVGLGAIFSVWLCLRYRLDAVHARNHVPGAIALLVCPLLRRRLIFDVRGIMAEEYEDAGIWSNRSLGFRMTKWVERRCLRRADGVVVLTNRIRRLLLPEADRRNVYVIPTCADIDALAAQRSVRDSTRASLGLANRTVLIYVGKLGGWYMQREMVEFFGVARQVQDDLFFIVLSQSDNELIRTEFRRLGVEDENFSISCASPKDVPMYLAAADLGISFIRPSPSKISSSPTKIGEYLGAGLPVVSSSGVGDCDEILSQSRCGVLVYDFDVDAYRRAATSALCLLREPDIADRCTAVARRSASLEDAGIPRYRELYRLVAATPRVGAGAPRA